MTGASLPLVGLFVGGQGTRMGGVAKGLLKLPGSGQSLLERLLGEVRQALPGAQPVLVGSATAYAALGLEAVPDRPAGVGPLGGLIALLAHAQARGDSQVLALACDLPRLDAALIGRLVGADAAASAVVTAQGNVRNPLVARYAVEPASAAAASALAAGKRSLQAVLDRLQPPPTSLALSAEEEALLDDWDTPSDMH
ncbi:MAG TPA: NTP transferase domain-containing protein [Polyangiaceae bacterium]